MQCCYFDTYPEAGRGESEIPQDFRVKSVGRDKSIATFSNTSDYDAYAFAHSTQGQKVPWGFDSSRVLPGKVETGKTRVMTSTQCCAERAWGEVVGAKAVSKPRKAFHYM
ncbi:hypothetical protein QTP88_024248 [Uroleucon formosanum]